ncbi:3-oxoacyl-[acyl-carrier-protein] synthase III C-terminal domain-containing protein [Nocardia higoensis]|uniref:3-oxoacyl-[acyl-carrier-protein] synthase III C-terminal domain-containing protein n=1 Tax=Nocardia higoensis TaxID=228599 RepID=UPI000593B14F|nr:3-oxoacyl-[acyl-carrier-protein] synthase III C-terminal domain-containing protein [Nocardia higoensis]
MRLRSAVAALPSRTVTNDDIVKWIGEHSADEFDGDLDAALRKVEYYLRYAGSRERQWLDEGERPIDLLRRAAGSAMDAAGVSPAEVDLLIYTGIGRGFIEPGGAYHSAAALGLRNAHCFDILDACMSWTRAVQVTDALFRNGTHRTAMIVNAECNLRSGGVVFPQLFRIRDASALESVFPAYTLGEAASATVLTADGDEPWRFEFASRPDLAPLCNVTLDGYEGYCDPSDKLAANGVGYFTSFGFEMHEQGAADGFAVFERLAPPIDEVTALFTHASSQRYWQGMADKVGLGHVVHHVFERTGNIVSASVPAAIASAIEQGVLRPGERALGWVGSAGMSFAAFSFVL